jgi:hypothetical protein
LEFGAIQTRFPNQDHGAALTKANPYKLHVETGLSLIVASQVSLSPSLFHQFALEKIRRTNDEGVTPLSISS